MTQWQEILSFAWSFEAVAFVGSIGWLFAVVCIVLRFDKDKDSKVCLIRDLVTSTFSVITFVGVVTFSVAFAIFLQKNQAARVEDQQRFSTVSAKQDEIMVTLAKLTVPQMENIAQAIDNTVRRAGRISDESVTRIVNTAFGGVFINSVQFRTMGERVEVKCVDFGDGGGLECKSNKN